MEHEIVSRQAWIEARTALLAKEKEFTRRRDELSAERRALPWVKVEKAYVFDGPDGKETLSELFAGRSQLIVKHFMLGPGWQQGCLGCSFGFALPVSTAPNALAYGTGLAPIGRMIRAGLLLDAIGFVTIWAGLLLLRT